MYRKEEDPTLNLGEEEMQQRSVFTGFGTLFISKCGPSHKTFNSWYGQVKTDENYLFMAGICRGREVPREFPTSSRMFFLLKNRLID